MRFMVLVKADKVLEAEDFGAEFTPELRAQEQRLRAGGPAQQGHEALAPA